MADTWATRKRAEAEAMAWADEPVGGGKRAPKVGGGMDDGAARMQRDEAIGHTETQEGANPRAYLGHFANPDVLEKGHNTGAKPIGVPAGSQAMAKSGYKSVAGSASKLVGSASYHGRHYGDEVDRMAEHASSVGLKEPKAVTSRRVKREAEWAAQMPNTDRAMKGAGPIHMAAPVPRAISDVKLSIKHHKESIANDMKHAKEHMASVKKHKMEMKTRQKQLAGRRRSR